MDVTLSKRGSYAAAAAICLARAYESGQPKKLREISAEMSIPRTFVSQILGDLVHAGIAVSSFGRDGGHRLARPPQQVTVAEVIEAAEGPLASARCALGDGPCRWHAVCPMHETMTAATASLREVLASTTLAVLAERDAAIARGAYPVPADSHRQATAISIADSVQVEVPVPVITARLSAATSWLTKHAESSDQDASLQGEAAGPARTVAIHLGPAAEDEAGMTIPLVWEASGPVGIYPRFDGDLRLTALDPDRSELRLSGHYRPAAGEIGHADDDPSPGRVARGALRSFLRRVAQGLEDEHAHQVRARTAGSSKPSIPG
jgi:Rrf2 family protein